uniref:SCAN box domain-containing protein n=1 Tax=Terrapene triunguis TaxID=2587831 RepID=A0A674I7D8_9SAUR
GAEETWALWLAPYLSGKAQAAYMALSEQQARNYETLRAAILDRVGLSSEKYCQKFRSARLMDWATHWFRPDTQMVMEIMDALVLEQFFQGLPENIRVWVR